MMRPSIIAFVLFLLAIPYAQAAEPEPFTDGQTVYVPAYSHILHGNIDRQGKPDWALLSAMLSVRNTDPKNGMTVLSVKYYDTEGKLLREYVKEPRKLGPMGSTDYFVENKDTAGGTGANFLVVWKADKPINPPVIETVNAYFFGTQSIAFTSSGRPIRAE
jgi:hypothetical protein